MWDFVVEDIIYEIKSHVLKNDFTIIYYTLPR